MCNNPSDINEARKKKRDRTGWTLKEIKKKAEEELREYKENTDSEPSDLASGDMDKIIRGEDDEDTKE